MRVVCPYRPYPPETLPHAEGIGPFDWLDAIRMMSASVAVTNRCKTHVITDAKTALPMPALRFKTTEQALMLWVLDVSRAYLESRHFNTDTVMVCPDLLVYRDLRGRFNGDLGLVIRQEEKHLASGRPLINGVQWWAVRAKDRLVAAFRDALRIAKTLPDEIIAWGADTEPLRMMAEPLQPGVHVRGGLSVNMIPCEGVLEALASRTIDRLESGEQIGWPQAALIDFRSTRKRYMRAFFEATYGQAVLA
jgi:hypothetical protein